MGTRDTYLSPASPKAHFTSRSSDGRSVNRVSGCDDHDIHYRTVAKPRDVENMWELEVKNLRRELAVAKKNQQEYMKAAYRERYSTFRRQTKIIKTRDDDSSRYEKSYGGSFDYNYDDTRLAVSDLPDIRNGFITSTPRSSSRVLQSSLDRSNSMRLAGPRTIKHLH